MSMISVPPHTPVQPAPTVLPNTHGERTLLEGVSWQTYDGLRNDLDDAGSGMRLTYDDGRLELELPGTIHEILLAFVTEMLTSYLLHHNIPYMPLGHTTWRRQTRRKGLEADACYYLKSVEEVERLTDIDLEVHAPPDLAIEAEVTSPLLAKLPIYAAVGIPELWHIRGDLTARMLRLDAAGNYTSIEFSQVVTAFTPKIIEHWLGVRMQSTHFEALRRFRAEFISK